MPQQQSNWVKLEVGRTPSGKSCWVSCLRPTASFYGWLDVFEEPAPPARVLPDGSRVTTYARASGRDKWGGKSLRICRASSKAGNPAGMTNRFRVSSAWRARDSALLAEVTTAEWAWMEAISGERRSKAEWLALADSIAGI